MNIYHLTLITRDTLKSILREGARANNILRITDECFERMIDSLNIPLDNENGNYKIDERSNENIEISEKIKVSGSYVRQLESINSNYEEKSSNDKFIIAKELLIRIQDIEKQSLDSRLEETRNTRKSTSIKPNNLTQEKIDELQDLKSNFKDICIELIKHRSEFTGLTDSDLGSQSSKQKIVNEELEDLVDIAKTPQNSTHFKFNI